MSDAMTDANSISTDQVRRIARLARIELAPAEADAARTSLASVLGYVDRIRALDLRGVEPLTHASGSGNRLDADTLGPTLLPDVIRAMAPASDGPFVVVPKVVGDGGRA